MIFKPHQVVIVTKDQDGSVHKGAVYELTTGNDGDDGVLIQGYELNREGKPTGQRHNLMPTHITIYDRKERARAIEEFRGLLAKRDKELARKQEQLMKYSSDFDEIADELYEIVRVNTNPDACTSAIAKFLKDKAKA